MKIKMVGIDYNKAGIGLRERFSMTQAAALEKLRALDGIGCVLLSTCNRTELWLSGDGDPFALLCGMKGLDGEPLRPYFTQRAGEDAVAHLFELACGMKSQVFGEDQIITQVGSALALAREAGSADAVLESLFRAAVTAAKEVKTAVRLTDDHRSVADSAVRFLKGKLGSLAGLRCLVIGNGEMGRLAAQGLALEGARVRMTLRSYRHGQAVAPQGVETVPYEERLGQLAQADIVLSATTSPHYTLRARELPPLGRPVAFCDLAVPRDIDPEIAGLENASLYDTDAICGGQPRVDPQAMKLAVELLRRRQEEFCRWYGFRPLVPAVGEISGLAARDLMGRVEKDLRRLPTDGAVKEALEQRLRDAAQKTVARLLFGLRETLPPELWTSCMDGLEKAAREVH